MVPFSLLAVQHWGKRRALEGAHWDGFQVLSEVCFRLLGGAGAEPTAQAGEVWLRPGITPSPPSQAQQGRTEFPGGRTLPAHVPHCPQGSDNALTMLPCLHEQHQQQLLRHRELRAQICRGTRHEEAMAPQKTCPVPFPETWAEGTRFREGNWGRNTKPVLPASGSALMQRIQLGFRINRANLHSCLSRDPEPPSRGIAPEKVTAEQCSNPCVCPSSCPLHWAVTPALGDTLPISAEEPACWTQRVPSHPSLPLQ